MKKETISIRELLEYKMESTPLVSVIIPVYNVEKYLRRCLDSVINQTYPNIEIILVDDGSEDTSGTICEEYKNRDTRITVIHQKNQGLSAARNVGFLESIGDYIAFVDSDDYVTNDYVHCMLSAAHFFNADIVQTKILITEQDFTEIPNSPLIKYKIIEPGKVAPNLYKYKVAAYGKLYSRDVIIGNQFPAGKIHEDDATYYRFAYKAKRICILDYFTYLYYQSPHSITRGSKGDKRTDYIQIYYERIRYFQEKDESELVLGSRERFCLITMLNYAAYKKNKTNGKDLDSLLQIFREQYPYLRQYTHIGLTRRICYALFNRFPGIVSVIINALR